MTIFLLGVALGASIVGLFFYAYVADRKVRT